MSLTYVVAMAASVLFPAAMIYAAVMDVLTYKIRNRLVAGIGLLWVALVPFSGLSLEAIGLSLLVGGAVLVVAFGLFAAGLIGGGDAKLAAVAALWFGWPGVVGFLALATVSGGLLTVLVLALRGTLLPARIASIGWVGRLQTPNGPVPYGAAFGAGALMAFPYTPWMQTVA